MQSKKAREELSITNIDDPLENWFQKQNDTLSVLIWQRHPKVKRAKDLKNRPPPFSNVLYRKVPLCTQDQLQRWLWAQSSHGVFDVGSSRNGLVLLVELQNPLEDSLEMNQQEMWPSGGEEVRQVCRVICKSPRISCCTGSSWTRESELPMAMVDLSHRQCKRSLVCTQSHF